MTTEAGLGLLTAKVGPFPLIVYPAAGAGGLLLYRWWKGRKAASSSTSTSPQPAPSPTPFYPDFGSGSGGPGGYPPTTVILPGSGTTTAGTGTTGSSSSSSGGSGGATTGGGGQGSTTQGGSQPPAVSVPIDPATGVGYINSIAAAGLPASALQPSANSPGYATLRPGQMLPSGITTDQLNAIGYVNSIGGWTAAGSGYQAPLITSRPS